LQGSATIKEKLEKARLELEVANRSHDFARMSELQYGSIPQLEKETQFFCIMPKNSRSPY